MFINHPQTKWGCFLVSKFFKWTMFYFIALNMQFQVVRQFDYIFTFLQGESPTLTYIVIHRVAPLHSFYVWKKKNKRQDLFSILSSLQVWILAQLLAEILSWCMRPYYAWVYYNLTSPYVDYNTFTMDKSIPESTLSPSQGLRIWPQGGYGAVILTTGRSSS